MTVATIAPFSGVHHVRVPVSDLAASAEFWRAAFGFEHDFDFPDGAGVALRDPRGGPSVVLWLDAAVATASKGFVHFGLAVPDTASLDALAEHLDAVGVTHGGFQPSFVERKLVFIEDPDGNLVNVYVARADADERSGGAR